MLHLRNWVNIRLRLRVIKLLLLSVIAKLGDVDGDGIAEFAAGAIYAEGNSPLSGVVYVYQGGQDSPELLARLNGTIISIHP